MDLCCTWQNIALNAKEEANREGHGKPHGEAHSRGVMQNGARANKEQDAMQRSELNGTLLPSPRNSIHKLTSLHPDAP